MSILAIALNPTIDISSNVHRVQPTQKMRTFNQKRHAGGGGVNVARVIAELGGRPELLVLSGGATGALLKDTLHMLPIHIHFVPIAEPTRIAFTVYEEETGFEYRFLPEGPEISVTELDQVFEILRQSRCQFIVASGSLPYGAPDDTYARMAKIAAETGAKFILDTSGAALRRTLEEAEVFLVKPNINELAELLGHPLEKKDIAGAAMHYVKAGRAHYVAVTLGTDGALLASKEGVLRIPAIEVAVKSAVGAGDSFIGALTWFLEQGMTMEEAFRFGVAAGAATSMTPGTELCHRTDVFSLYEAEN